MTYARRLDALLAALLLCAPGWAQTEPPQPAEPRTQPLDIRSFRPPALTGSIVGAYRYTSPFDGESRRLTIVEAGGERRSLEGRMTGGAERAVLRLEPAAGGVGYQGRATSDFDPCLRDEAQVDKLIALADTLVLELLVAHSALTRLPGCTEGLEFTLSGAGEADVRLRPASELELPTGDASRTFVVNAPRLAVGSAVKVSSTVVDTQGQRWTQVEAAGSGKPEDARSGWVRSESVVTRLRYELREE